MNRDTREAAATESFVRIAAGLPAELAKLTGAAWTGGIQSEENQRYAKFQRAGAYSIGLYLETYPKPRVRASLVAPVAATGETIHWSYVAEYVNGGREPSPGIGVSPDKGAAGVARDIARRLLPALDAAWPRFVARMDAERETRDGFAAAVSKLRGFGGEVREDANGRSQTAYAYFFSKDRARSLRLTVERGGRVTINDSFEWPAAESIVRAVLAAKLEG